MIFLLLKKFEIEHIILNIWINILNKMSGKTLYKKSTVSTIKIWKEYIFRIFYDFYGF
jgi:hypothetical protein